MPRQRRPTVSHPSTAATRSRDEQRLVAVTVRLRRARSHGAVAAMFRLGCTADACGVSGVQQLAAAAGTWSVLQTRFREHQLDTRARPRHRGSRRAAMDRTCSCPWRAGRWVRARSLHAGDVEARLRVAEFRFAVWAHVPQECRFGSISGRERRRCLHRGVQPEADLAQEGEIGAEAVATIMRSACTALARPSCRPETDSAPSASAMPSIRKGASAVTAPLSTSAAPARRARRAGQGRHARHRRNSPRRGGRRNAHRMRVYGTAFASSTRSSTAFIAECPAPTTSVVRLA